MTLLKCPVTDAQISSVTRVYGTKLGDVEYLRFLEDSNCLHLSSVPLDNVGKVTYFPKDIDFTGANDVKLLLDKIKEFVYRNRIRLGEFFQDHDLLRKGIIDATKFRTTLYAQKLQLTTEEYVKLENHFRCAEHPQKVRYFDFNEEVEKIFTEKDLEKCPTKTLSEFKVPSILDPRNQLSVDEEKELNDIMVRIGTDVKHRRLLIKPFFQDKDKSKSGFVTNTRFRSIFDN